MLCFLLSCLRSLPILLGGRSGGGTPVAPSGCCEPTRVGRGSPFIFLVASASPSHSFCASHCTQEENEEKHAAAQATDYSIILLSLSNNNTPLRPTALYAVTYMTSFNSYALTTTRSTHPFLVPALSQPLRVALRCSREEDMASGIRGQGLSELDYCCLSFAQERCLACPEPHSQEVAGRGLRCEFLHPRF